MNVVDSDSDQALLPEPLPSSRNRTVVQLTLGVAFVCALAGALALRVGPARSAPAAQNLDGIDDFIRAYAAERGRPPFTETEVKAIRGFMDKTNPQRANKPLAKLRALEEEEELSEECTNAIEAGVKKIIKHLARLAVDWALECWWGGEESDGCAKTMKEIDDFNKTVIEHCEKEGDLCTITQTHHGKNGTKTESENVCIPKECHDELEAATQATAKQIQEREAEVAQDNGGLGSHDLSGDDVDIKC